MRKEAEGESRRVCLVHVAMWSGKALTPGWQQGLLGPPGVRNRGSGVSEVIAGRKKESTSGWESREQRSNLSASVVLDRPSLPRAEVSSVHKAVIQMRWERENDEQQWEAGSRGLGLGPSVFKPYSPEDHLGSKKRALPGPSQGGLPL